MSNLKFGCVLIFANSNMADLTTAITSGEYFIDSQLSQKKVEFIYCFDCISGLYGASYSQVSEEELNLASRAADW